MEGEGHHRRPQGIPGPVGASNIHSGYLTRGGEGLTFTGGEDEPEETSQNCRVESM